MLLVRLFTVKRSLFAISYKYSSLLEKQKYIKLEGLVLYANTMLQVKSLVIRTKTMVNILKPIVEKFVELDSFRPAGNVYSESEAKHICCIMEGIYTSLLQLPVFEGSECEELNIQLKVAVDDFNAVYGLVQVENRTVVTVTQLQVVGRNLLELLYKILHFEDCTMSGKIQESLSKCQHVLCDMQKAKGDIITEFKNFVEEILYCRESLNAYAFNLVSQKHRDLILLCGSQIQKCIPLMFKIYETGGWTDAVTCKESGSYLFSRMQCCLSELTRVINADQKEESDDGHFVHQMDLVLDILASVKVKEEFNDIMPQVKRVADELLCQAMAIAQVSVANDSSNVTASCYKVLHVLENIKKESSLSTVNIPQRQLYCYSLANALESLEQQINSTLLRLVLEVFSEPYSPLKNLVKASCNVHLAEDLEQLVSVLDLHVDRMMQIGMFAVACSEDEGRILGIRSCLASLESLEPELVPALTACYSDRDKLTHRNHLKMLSDHWQSEVLKLEELIDGIVDPLAFFQITLEEVYKMVATLKISLDREKPYLKMLLHGIHKKSLKLVKHLYVSTLGTKNSPSELKLKEAIDELHHACKECSAMMNVFLSGSQCHEDSVCHSRVLKRCKLIVSCMKKLQPLLLELTDCTHPLEDREGSASGHANAFKTQGDTLVFPETIRGLSLDISDSDSGTGCMAADGVVMKRKLEDAYLKTDAAFLPYLEKGKKLYQERNILYQTPKSVKKNNRMSTTVNQSLTQRTRRRLFSRNESVGTNKHTETTMLHFSMDDSLHLEVTDILERLTSLSCTLVMSNASR